MSVASLALVLLLAAGLAAADSPVPPAAEKILALFEQLSGAGTQPGSAPRHLSFALSEDEINTYIRYALRTAPRPGLDSVTLKIFPRNYVSTLSVIDFDAIERWQPGTIPPLLRPVLRGRQTIWVDFRFAIADSVFTFSVEKAYYDKLRLPAWFVENVIQILAARQPEQLDTSRPLPLPFDLRYLRTESRMLKGGT